MIQKPKRPLRPQYKEKNLFRCRNKACDFKLHHHLILFICLDLVDYLLTWIHFMKNSWTNHIVSFTLEIVVVITSRSINSASVIFCGFQRGKKAKGWSHQCIKSEFTVVLCWSAEHAHSVLNILIQHLHLESKCAKS